MDELIDNSCVSYGSARKAGENNREWITGPFYPEPIGLRSAPVEIKWSFREKGWIRGWSDFGPGTSLTILVSGSMKLFFSGAAEEEVTLSEPGDYVMWCPDAKHDCEALSDCTVITVRWNE